MVVGTLNDFVKSSHEKDPMATIVSLVGTVSALYGIVGGPKLNTGGLKSVNGAILMAGVPLSIGVGIKALRQIKSNEKNEFKDMYWMALPAVVAITLGVVGMMTKEKPQCQSAAAKYYEDDDDDDDEDEEDDDDDEDEDEDEDGKCKKGEKGEKCDACDKEAGITMTVSDEPKTE